MPGGRSLRSQRNRGRPRGAPRELGGAKARIAADSRAGWRFAGAVSPGGRSPVFDLPEIAFAGRSNVGKSTIINRLTRTPGLARTSSTPGRTQQINFFVGTLGQAPTVLADLPGYGFARVPESVRASWKPLVEDYLRGRERLCAVAVILDARRGLGEDDARLFDFLAACGRPAVAIVNKIDKLRRNERQRVLDAIAERIPDAVPFSGTSGEGEKELWRRLTRLAAVR